MIPFSIYHDYRDHFAIQEQYIVRQILNIVNPDRISLLGATVYTSHSQSIFNGTAPTKCLVNDFFLLVLLPELGEQKLHEWQDKIENCIKGSVSITTIVVETTVFLDWLNTSNSFALKCWERAVPIYDAGTLHLEKNIPYQTGDEHTKLGQSFTSCLHKAHAFLKGSEHYVNEGERGMAAFMLHQASEQALYALVKMGTGYHAHTHNLRKLMRYAALIEYQLEKIFTTNSEGNNRLFTLLRDAYIDTRYREAYKITSKDLELLTEKVRSILEIVEDSGKQILEKKD